jgi:hypothetical protein
VHHLPVHSAVVCVGASLSHSDLANLSSLVRKSRVCLYFMASKWWYLRCSPCCGRSVGTSMQYTTLLVQSIKHKNRVCFFMRLLCAMCLKCVCVLLVMGSSHVQTDDTRTIICLCSGPGWLSTWHVFLATILRTRHILPNQTGSSRVALCFAFR